VASPLLMTTPAARAKNNPARKQRRPSSQANWVRQTLKKMTLREKLGQMLMVEFFGGFAPAGSAEHKELLREIEENHVGGLIIGTRPGPLGLERSQLYPTVALTNDLQRRAKIPLLVGADFESGTRMRLAEGTAYPSAMSIAATGNPKLAYAAGKSIATEARAAGVHWIFAPVADVNNNPDNPIINLRSFGENARSVADYVAQFVRGVEDHGALATAKHFPGHGNVNVDSHLALATVSGSRSELDSTELLPFRAAIRARVSSIMPGHLAVPALEPDPKLPATLSRHILTGLLRGEMKFRGLIVTDAMNMGGVTSLYPPGEAAVRAIEAGANVLLMPPVPGAAIEALADAVKSGRIPMKHIDASVLRILEAKARLGLNKNRLVDAARLNETFGRPEYQAESQGIADRGATLLRDAQRVLPLDATRPLRALLVALSADPDAAPGQALEAEIRARADSLTVLRADTQFSRTGNLKLPSSDTYDVAIAALFVRVADRKGNVGFPEDQRAIVNELLATGQRAVIVAFGSPYLIERFPKAQTWLAAFSTNEVLQRAAARALFGQIEISGKIPVTVPGTATLGDGIRVALNPMTLGPASTAMRDHLKPAYDLLDQGVRQAAFPGGVLATGWNDHLAIHSFGKLGSNSGDPKVMPSTIYDVASLTKPIVTTTAAMMLNERGELDLDAPIARYLPEFARTLKSSADSAWRSQVTVRMLLLHDSGLTGHRDFYLGAKGKGAMLARVFAEPLVREPGTNIEYSDLGFILLGAIIERLTGTSLDFFANKYIFGPLRMNSSAFNPPRPLRRKIAPTENDTVYRRRLIRGEVHDENASAMGGVAGHAGLFSTAADISAFAQMMLNGGIYAHHRLLSRATIAEFTARQSIGGTDRALGWDVPEKRSSSGSYLSARSFGHTGFTGTSLWIDPERQLFVVLLTNRVNPTRANDTIRQVRPAVHDAILESLGLAAGRAAAR